MRLCRDLFFAKMRIFEFFYSPEVSFLLTFPANSGMIKEERRCGMDEKITIEIHNSNTLVNYGVVALVIALSIWLAVILNNFSAAGLIAFLVVTAASVGWIILYETKPTVITADCEGVTYKHLLPVKTIKLSEIKSLICEPYEVHARYTSYQRVKLCISLKNGDEVELNDCVDTGGLVTDVLDKRQSEIKIITLYNFINDRCTILKATSEKE